MKTDILKRARCAHYSECLDSATEISAFECGDCPKFTEAPVADTSYQDRGIKAAAALVCEVFGRFNAAGK
ncbi:MAG: hypothetical protein AB9866_05455 [Syntrophobacteraceae bacterium]